MSDQPYGRKLYDISYSLPSGRKNKYCDYKPPVLKALNPSF